MNFCNYCYTRLDACADCHEAELSAMDQYIEAQDVIISGQRKEIEALGKHNEILNEARERCGESIESLLTESVEKDKEIESLKAQIAAMKECGNCKHYYNKSIDVPCLNCAHATDLPKWELTNELA